MVECTQHRQGSVISHLSSLTMICSSFSMTCFIKSSIGVYRPTGTNDTIIIQVHLHFCNNNYAFGITLVALLNVGLEFKLGINFV